VQQKVHVHQLCCSPSYLQVTEVHRAASTCGFCHCSRGPVGGCGLSASSGRLLIDVVAGVWCRWCRLWTRAFTLPLCAGAKSCPPIKLYTVDTLEEGLQSAAEAFCGSDVSLDASAKKVRLFCSWGHPVNA